jgi:hypothetical protein
MKRRVIEAVGENEQAEIDLIDRLQHQREPRNSLKGRSFALAIIPKVSI